MKVGDQIYLKNIDEEATILHVLLFRDLKEWKDDDAQEFYQSQEGFAQADETIIISHADVSNVRSFNYSHEIEVVA